MVWAALHAAEKMTKMTMARMKMGLRPNMSLNLANMMMAATRDSACMSGWRNKRQDGKEVRLTDISEQVGTENPAQAIEAAKLVADGD